MNLKPVCENTIMAIETEPDGKKMCHFYAYGAIKEDGTAEMIEYTFFIAPIQVVVAHGALAFENEMGAEYKQYVTSYNSVDELVSAYAQYDNGQMPQLLHVVNLTVDTPDGCYILCKDDEIEQTCKKYVLSAADSSGLDITVYDTYNEAFSAMKTAYEMFAPDTSKVCKNADDILSCLCESDCYMGEWSARCTAVNDCVNGEETTYWEITEVKI